MAINMFLMLADIYHCSRELQINTLKRRANGVEDDRNDNSGIQKAKRRFLDCRHSFCALYGQGLCNENNSNNHTEDSKCCLPYAAQRPYQQARNANGQILHKEKVDSNMESTPRRTARLLQNDIAECATKDNMTIKYEKDVSNGDIFTHKQGHGYATTTNDSFVPSSNSHHTSHNNPLITVNDGVDWQQQSYLSSNAFNLRFSFLSFTKFRTFPVTGTNVYTASLSGANDVPTSYRATSGFIDASRLQQQSSKHIFVLETHFDLKNGKMSILKTNNNVINVQNKDEPIINACTNSKETNSKMPELIDYFLRNKEAQKITSSNIISLYINFIAYKCFEYNKGLECHILKNDLWELHEYMTEFYFYIMWKLETLETDIKKIVSEVEKELEEKKGTIEHEINERAEDGHGSPEERKKAHDEYREEKFESYKKHLMDEMQLINEIINQYYYMQKLQTLTNRSNDIFASNVAELSGLIYQLRKETHEYLLAYHQDEKVTLIYEITQQMRIYPLAKTEVSKNGTDKSINKKQSSSHYKSDFMSVANSKALENHKKAVNGSLKSAILMVPFTLDYTNFKTYDIVLANIYAYANPSGRKSIEFSGVLIDHLLRPAKNLLILHDALKKICEYINFIGSQPLNLVIKHLGYSTSGVKVLNHIDMTELQHFTIRRNELRQTIVRYQKIFFAAIGITLEDN